MASIQMEAFMFTWLKEKWNQLTTHQVAEAALLKPGVTMNYLLNDSTTPTLVKSLFIPPPPNNLRLLVHGHKLHEGSPQPGSEEEIAANCYITLVKTINMVQNQISKFRPMAARWAACDRLSVFPFAGKDFNAYYDRRSLKFFYDKDPVTNKRVYTAFSSDIVAHELGHAILDFLRPDFWSVQSLEIWAFHEAFADITALTSLIQHEEVIEYMLLETSGDIRKSNVASKLAEEMGNAIYHVTRGQYGYTLGALREATNNFKYVSPNKLPKDAPNNELASECHSFGRVFLGAWYEMLSAIYEQEIKDGSLPITAVKTASQVCYEYLLRAVCLAPRIEKFHQAIAKTILAEDKRKGSPYQKIIQSVFQNRNLITPQMKVLSRKTWEEIKTKLKPEDLVMQRRDNIMVNIKNNKQIKLANHVSGDVSMMSTNGIDLANIYIEIAEDAYYEFDENGIMIEEILPSTTDAIDAAKLCVLSIQSSGNIGPSPELMWEVENGKLLRTLIE